MIIRVLAIAWAFGLLIGLVQPLHLPIWLSWHSEIPVFAGFALSAISYGFTPQRIVFKSSTASLAGVNITIFGLTAIALIQWLTNLIPFRGDVFLIWAYLGTFFLAINVGIQDQRAASLIAWVLWIAALLNAGVTFAQALSVNDGWSHTMVIWGFDRPTGNLGQANHNGTLMVLGIGAGYFLLQLKVFHQAVLSMSTLVLVCSLALTQSRTALLALFISTSFVFLRTRLCRENIQNLYWIKTTVIATVCFLALPALVQAYQEGCIRCIDQVSNDIRLLSDSSGRALIWPQMLHLGSQNPFFGGGLLQLPGLQVEYWSDFWFRALPLTYAHNIALDLWVGSGAIGLGLFVLFVFSLFHLMLKSRAKPELLLGSLIVIPIGIHSLLEYPHAYIYMLTPLGIGIGLLMRQGKPELSLLSSRKQAASFIFGIVFAIGAALAIVEYINMEEDFRIARFESLKIGAIPLGYKAPESMIFDQLGILLSAVRVIPKAGMPQQDIDVLEKAVKRFHWSALHHRYALSLALNGDPEKAERVLLILSMFWGDEMYLNVLKQWKNWSSDQYPELAALSLITGLK